MGKKNKINDIHDNDNGVVDVNLDLKLCQKERDEYKYQLELCRKGCSEQKKDFAKKNKAQQDANASLKQELEQKQKQYNALEKEYAALDGKYKALKEESKKPKRTDYKVFYVLDIILNILIMGHIIFQPIRSGIDMTDYGDKLPFPWHFILCYIIFAVFNFVSIVLRKREYTYLKQKKARIMLASKVILFVVELVIMGFMFRIPVESLQETLFVPCFVGLILMAWNLFVTYPYHKGAR